VPRIDFPNQGSQLGKTLYHFERQQFSPKRIVEIVIEIGNFVRSIRHLTLKTSLVQKFGQPHRMSPVASVFQDAFPRFIAEVKARILKVSLFQQVDHA